MTPLRLGPHRPHLGRDWSPNRPIILNSEFPPNATTLAIAFHHVPHVPQSDGVQVPRPIARAIGLLAYRGKSALQYCTVPEGPLPLCLPNLFLFCFIVYFFIF